MKLSSPISVFIIASAGVHAGLVINSYSTNITLPGSTGSVMAVKLQTVKKTVKQSSINNKAKIKQVKKIVQTTDKTKKPVITKELVQKNKTLTKTRTLSNLTPDTPLTSSNTKESTQPINKEKEAKSKAHVIAIIYKALNQHFTYPRIAQRRNWQGKVLLSIHITAAGEIKNIKLSQSSGYSILDQAAISSLTKVRELPQLTSWLPYDIDLTLPVIYQLTEG